MRTINISISDLEYNKFGLTEDKLSFSEFIDIVSRELARQNLKEAVKLGEKYDYSKTTMKDIDREIKSVRKNAKGNN